MPAIERPNRGQRRALAYLWQRRITLPKWARSPWVTLHEMAHLLVQANEPPHGPRFVGVLIGLACRHLDYDAQELMRVADQAGVRYHVKSIGSVPVRGIQWRAEKALGVEGPMTPIDLACWLSLGTYHEPVTWRQVQGAMLGAIAAGRIRPPSAKQIRQHSHAQPAQRKSQDDVRLFGMASGDSHDHPYKENRSWQGCGDRGKRSGKRRRRGDGSPERCGFGFSIGPHSHIEHQAVHVEYGRPDESDAEAATVAKSELLLRQTRSGLVAGVGGRM